MFTFVDQSNMIAMFSVFCKRSSEWFSEASIFCAHNEEIVYVGFLQICYWLSLQYTNEIWCHRFRVRSKLADHVWYPLAHHPLHRILHIYRYCRRSNRWLRQCSINSLFLQEFHTNLSADDEHAFPSSSIRFLLLVFSPLVQTNAFGSIIFIFCGGNINPLFPSRRSCWR